MRKFFVAAFIAGLILTGCQRAHDPYTIRFSWWGNEARNNATIEAIRLFESLNPGVTIIPEFGPVDGYFTRLMAQVAAGNAPDIFTLTPEAIPTYWQMGALADLTGRVDLSSHNPEIVRASTVNGRLYGVNLSLNANVLIYNRTLANELGIVMPQGDFTWEELIALLAEVHQRSGGQVYGMPDIRMIVPLDLFIPVWNMTYRDKEPPFPWTDNDILMTGQDVEAFMEFWSNVPYGVLLPPDETATLVPHISAPIGTRRTFLELNFTGTFAMIQSQTLDELGMIPYPNNRRGRGEAVSARPGLVQVVFSRSRNQDLAAQFLEWLATDPEAGKLLGTVRGVLPSYVQVEAMLAVPDLLSAEDQIIFDVTNRIFEGNVNPFSPGPPDMGGVWDNLIAVGQGVAFGMITPQEAGQRFEELVEFALR